MSDWLRHCPKHDYVYDQVCASCAYEWRKFVNLVAATSNNDRLVAQAKTLLATTGKDDN